MSRESLGNPGLAQLLAEGACVETTQAATACVKKVNALSSLFKQKTVLVFSVLEVHSLVIQ